MVKGFDQLLKGVVDQGLIPFIGIVFMPDQGDMPPNPVIGFMPYMPLIIGRVVMPIPRGLAEPQPVLLLFPSMLSDIAFIITSIIRNMAPKISAVAFAGEGAGTDNTITSASMTCFFFRYVIDSDCPSRLYP